LPAIAGDKLTRYPGSRDLQSPNGLFVLNNLEIETGDLPHLLVVRNVKTTKEEFRLPYKRYVEVLWSPDGSHLLINDHGGSDYSDCMIISFRDTDKRVDVSELLRRGTENLSVTQNHHVFIEGVEWLGNDRVMVKVYGYGDIDPDGFTQSYIYEIGKGFPAL
jgi:hypothetical protein